MPKKQISKANAAQDIERRILPPGDIELRIDDGDKPRLSGYAAKYGIFTDLVFFREKIKAGAFDEALKDSDVRCLKNHDSNLILGRTKSGTLRLESNTVGLKFDDDVPDTTTGRDMLEEVRRGDISGCSFCFTVAEDIWKYFDNDTPPERTIVKIGELFDVGPVTFPAYPDTTVAARSLEAARRAAGESTNEPSPSDASAPADQSKGSDAPEGSEQEISAERRRDIDRKYRYLGQMIARNRPAEV